MLCLWTFFQIYEVFVSLFVRVFILFPIGYRCVSRVTLIKMEMRIYAPLSEDLTQNNKNLFLLI